MTDSTTRTEFLTDLALFWSAKMVEVGVERGRAVRMGLAFADEFAERWQGEVLYIPKNRALRTAIRHAAVRSQFTGDNHQELAKIHGYNVRTIYKILKPSR
jgi:Mor family transcriptional regulator